MESVPQWFMSIAEIIDWSAIDREMQQAFRDQLIDTVNRHIPTKRDGAITKAGKVAALKLLALAKVKR